MSGAEVTPKAACVACGVLPRLILFSSFTAFASSLAVAAEPAATVDYLRDVKPILQRRCYACHGALRQRAGLRLDTAELARKGSEGGLVIVPGNSEESLLIAAVTGELGFRMPPEGEEPLEPEQIAVLKAWIDGGAEAQPEEPPAEPRTHWAFQVPTRPEVPAFVSPSPSGGGGFGWEERARSHNPIDAFLAVDRVKHDLVPVPPAEKHVLLRRVYVDLVGLPPSRDELSAFLADDSPGAYERVVDKLLASPRYGERWGRHWMDVWRYSDWSGYANEIRNSQRHIWHWRDWIIESLNRDKGYDQMIREMLAGDELAPTDADALRATGYLARSWYKFNRNTWLEQTIEHTAKGFLGLTFHCARCHDHKYDPIANEDYYHFRAFFEPHQVRTDRLPGRPDLMQDGIPRVFDADLKAATYVFARGDERNPIQEKTMPPALPGFLGGELEIEPISLPVEAYYEGRKPFVRDEELAAAETVVSMAQGSLAEAGRTLEQSRKRIAELANEANSTAESEKPGATADAVAALAGAKSAALDSERSLAQAAESAQALAEKRLAAAQSRLVALRARFAADDAKCAIPPRPDAEPLAMQAAHAERQAAVAKAEEDWLAADQKLAAAKQASDAETEPGKKATAAAEAEVAQARKALATAEAALSEPSADYTPITEVHPATSTGRRLALARWIANRENPLTARVAVNHVWLRHFGAPLVASVFDFGMRGSKPTHPELLDWLAVELMESGWSMKHLHRLLVTSNAYRMQSSGAADSPNRERDPENRYLWRMNPVRMEAEVVRDSVLQVAGNLDDTVGGPDLAHEEGLRSRRRSVYYQHAYEKQMTFLKLFDAASVDECYRRKPSVVPQQALALANSTLALDQSRLLARRLSGQVPPAADSAFIAAAFEQVLGRPATDDEQTVCLDFLDRQAMRLQDPGALTAFEGTAECEVPPSADPRERARENLVHVLLNHNDFVTIR